jgi:hypothetical protein
MSIQILKRKYNPKKHLTKKNYKKSKITIENYLNRKVFLKTNVKNEKYTEDEYDDDQNEDVDMEDVDIEEKEDVQDVNNEEKEDVEDEDLVFVDKTLNLETEDVILFKSRSWYSKLTYFFTELRLIN